MLETEQNSSDKKNVFTFALKLVGRLCVVLTILVVIGWFVLTCMEIMLKNEIEHLVTYFAEVTAQTANERFNGELTQMERYARQISVGNMTPQTAVSAINLGEAGVYSGIYDLAGNLVAGRTIPEKVAAQIS